MPLNECLAKAIRVSDPDELTKNLSKFFECNSLAQNRLKVLVEIGKMSFAQVCILGKVLLNLVESTPYELIKQVMKSFVLLIIYLDKVNAT